MGRLEDTFDKCLPQFAAEESCSPSCHPPVLLLSLSARFKLRGKQLCPISLFSFLSLTQVRRKALQEEIDRESGKTEASEPRKWTVSLMLRLWSVAYPGILTPPSSPCTMRSRVMGDHVSPGPRGCPSLPAGSLPCRTCPELISFLLKGVLASLLESRPSKISSLNLCLLLWTGGVSHTLVTEGM